MRQQAQDAYKLGRTDRARNKPKKACPYMNSNLREWWFKGWDDKEAELGK